MKKTQQSESAAIAKFDRRRILEGKVAVVTGAGSGLGRATARLRSETGARQVILWTRTDDYLGYAFSRDVYEKGGASQHLVAYGPELGDHLEKQMVLLAVECWKRGSNLPNVEGTGPERK